MQSLRCSLPRGPARFLGTAIAALAIFFLLFGNRRQQAQATLPEWLGGVKPEIQRDSPYYITDTQPFFPPIKSEAGGGQRDFCSTFPVHLLDNIQIVLRTGSGDHERLDAQLQTVSSCIKNLIIMSDFEERRGKHHMIDILQDLPESYRINNPDFEAYDRQKAALKNGQGQEKTRDGWNLDKYKFIPMVERTYQLKPNAEWYVFIETDTYIFWDTLFRLISQYNPKEPHYLGAPVPGADHLFFGYGGAGFVLSQGLMKDFVPHEKDTQGNYLQSNITERYAEHVRQDCCGDSALAWAILDKTGVRLARLWPVFNGDEYVKIRVEPYNWCTPLLAMHHLTPEQMTTVWEWERTRPDDGQPILHSTLLFSRHPDILTGKPRKYWDNTCTNELPSDHPGHKSLEACQFECSQEPTCWQYTYIAKVCRFGDAIVGGHETMREKQYAAGWDVAKVKGMGFRNDTIQYTGCERILWTKPQTWT